LSRERYDDGVTAHPASAAAQPGQSDQTGGRHHGNRYRRSEEARVAVLEAVDDLLAERGLAGVTIEGIASRAHVAKQTIYRWWPSLTDLLFDALVADLPGEFSPPDHGDLGDDLRDHLRQVAAFLTETDAGAVWRALAAQALQDPQIAARFEVAVTAPLRERDRLPFEQARARGQLPAAVDVELAVDEVVGPVYYRALITGQPVSPAFTDALVDRLLPTWGS
jgi:AcrR family transcriptional regulator